MSETSTTSLSTTLKQDLVKFEGFLKTAGKVFTKGLDFAAKEAPSVTALASLLLGPQAASEVALAATVITLLRNSIITVEQKYAAAGIQSGTGAEKAAEVLTLSGDAAVALLQKLNVKADLAYVSKLITAVVGVMNVAPAIAGA